MSETTCLLSSSSCKIRYSSLLFSDLILLCSFILSHPLYFSYFIFFSPYLLKLLSFLSPLFITTSLLLFALLTLSPPAFVSDFFPTALSENKVSFLFATYNTFVQRLLSGVVYDQEEDIPCLEDFEAYKIVFDTPMIEQVQVSVEKSMEEHPSPLEGQVIKCSSSEDSSFRSCDHGLSDSEQETSADSSQMESPWAVMEGKRLERFLKELHEFDNDNVMSCNVEEKKIEQQQHPPCTEVDKAVEKQKEESAVRNGSEAQGNKIRGVTVKVGSDDYKQGSPIVKPHSRRLGSRADCTEIGGEYGSRTGSSRTLDYNLGSYGSMRKEKEWKRTLACKLFEERHNVDGGEGMDSLWETYETDSTKAKLKRNHTKSKSKSKKKGDQSQYFEEEKDDIDVEEEDMGGQLCCLQALKFSAGKMNLGMGRPNLVKISKALKGFGWLHHVSRHGKKVHHGDRF